jgi:hypothetical protein
LPPLFERRHSDLDPVAMLTVLQRKRLARGHPRLHLVEPVSITAQPANQIAVGDGIALMKAVALPTGIEDRTHRTVVRPREHEANLMTGTVAITEKSRGAGTQIVQGCGYDVSAINRTAAWCEHRPSRDGGADREPYDNQNRCELRPLHDEKSSQTV